MQHNEIVEFIEAMLARPVAETGLSAIDRDYLETRLKLIKYHALAADAVDQLDESLSVLRGQVDHVATLFTSMDEEICAIDALLAKPHLAAERIN